MVMYSDERRIAALLRELIQRSGTALESIEERLGWQRGRLGILLDGPQGVSFEVLLEVLPALDETPGDFFARLCGFHPETPSEIGALHASRSDHRFEESRRVVKAAIARRSTWKHERTAS
jgi:transcriptional regulator with XRE-family HTH domain